MATNEISMISTLRTHFLNEPSCQSCIWHIFGILFDLLEIKSIEFKTVSAIEMLILTRAGKKIPKPTPDGPPLSAYVDTPIKLAALILSLYSGRSAKNGNNVVAPCECPI